MKLIDLWKSPPQSKPATAPAASNTQTQPKPSAPEPEPSQDPHEEPMKITNTKPVGSFRGTEKKPFTISNRRGFRCGITK